MTHFLDKLPYDFNDPAGRDLWYTLADNFLSKPEVRVLIQQAVSPADVNWDQPMRWVWHEILELARRRDKLTPLLDAIAAGGDAAVAGRIRELTAAEPLVAAPVAEADLVWNGVAEGDERIIGAEPTFLDVSFLRRGLELSPAVCKLVMTFEKDYLGTAFVIGPDLLLTNHHNLFDKDHGNARTSRVDAYFGYERAFGGAEAVPTIIPGDIGSIRGEPQQDWGVITLAAPMPAGITPIALRGAPPPRVDDRVYVIQHPGGQPKKIGMVHNAVQAVDDNRVRYLTDTDGGSSGSPVFNEQWQLVALHHHWVSRTVNGRIQFLNQGVRIERVVEGLVAEHVI